MKKYRLKKDLPTVRAGEVFVRKTNETMQTDMLYHVDSEDVFLPPSIEVDDINNFDEWFEEVKEFEEWKPKPGEGFKVMNISGGVSDYYDWADSESDRFLWSSGNCYSLDTPDDLIIKEQKLIPQALHRLKMAAKKAWFEFDGSEGPDWVGDERSYWPARYRQEKYYLAYDYLKNTIVCDYTNIWQHIGGVYFPTKESAQVYIDNNPEDLKLLFGVE